MGKIERKLCMKKSIYLNGPHSLSFTLIHSFIFPFMVASKADSKTIFIRVPCAQSVHFLNGFCVCVHERISNGFSIESVGKSSKFVEAMSLKIMIEFVSFRN